MKLRRLDANLQKELMGQEGNGNFESGSVIGIELIGKDVVQNWLIMQGPMDATSSRSQNSDTIRGAFAKDLTRNVCSGSLN